MRPSSLLPRLAALAALAAPPAAAFLNQGECGDEQRLSCSTEAFGAKPCCVASPGLLLFRQRFEPDLGGDAGSWSIEGCDILECDGRRPTKPTNDRLAHEEIASICADSPYVDVDVAERAWAQSESGESIEELWERTWNHAGRYLSVLCDGNIGLFFGVLLELQRRLPTGQWLAEADITPSLDTTYRLSDIVDALSIVGHGPIIDCDNATLTGVTWPTHIRGPLMGFAPTDAPFLESSCPADGIVYPPSIASVLFASPTPTNTFDPIRRPSMRPITMSADEARRLKYPDDDAPPAPKKKLNFFAGNDARRAAGEHGHDAYARDDGRAPHAQRDEL